MADTTVQISGGGLVDNTYTLAQFHLHWGASSATGSEHFINGVQYPLEVKSDGNRDIQVLQP